MEAELRRLRREVEVLRWSANKLGAVRKGIAPLVQQRLGDVPFPANLGDALFTANRIQDGFKFDFWTEATMFSQGFWSPLRYDTPLLGCPEFPPHYICYYYE